MSNVVRILVYARDQAALTSFVGRLTNRPVAPIETSGEEGAPLIEGVVSSDEGEIAFVAASHLTQALTRLHHESFDGVCLLDPNASRTSFLLEARGLLHHIPDAMLLLDDQLRIMWHNPQLRKFAKENDNYVGERFIDVFEEATYLGPDFGPLQAALASGEGTKTILGIAELTFLDLTATPLGDANAGYPTHLLVMLRDVSSEIIHKQKLDAIHRAGLELADFELESALDMTVDERKELLKEKILNYTQDVLEFDTFEIRLIDHETNELMPLLEDGMEPAARDRKLMARAEGNGVTGFVASTGRSYLCKDTTQDPLYISGAADARSSLTVPLILHEGVLGTFNVESPRIGTFSQADLQFLELFCRELAVALNNLNLLEVEHATTITEFAYELLSDISAPIDELLNAASWIREKFLGQDQPVVDRLDRILQYARNVRGTIKSSSEQAGPKLADSGNVLPAGCEVLRSRRVLLVDSDAEIRCAAHDLLERLGCIVETAHDGNEALIMARAMSYDTAIVDIRLPDMSGSECYRRFREFDAHLPIVLMTGFGYDAGHSLVKARQMGMKTVLYKPFRRDLLINAVVENLRGMAPPTPPAVEEGGAWAVD